MLSIVGTNILPTKSITEEINSKHFHLLDVSLWFWPKKLVRQFCSTTIYPFEVIIDQNKVLRAHIFVMGICKSWFIKDFIAIFSILFQSIHFGYNSLFPLQLIIFRKDRLLSNRLFGCFSFFCDTDFLFPGGSRRSWAPGTAKRGLSTASFCAILIGSRGNRAKSATLQGNQILLLRVRLRLSILRTHQAGLIILRYFSVLCLYLIIQIKE